MEPNHPVRKYFCYDPVKNTSACLISLTCPQHSKPLKGNHGGNLKNHISRKHKKQNYEVNKLLEGLSATDLKRKRSEATSDDTDTLKIQLSKRRLTDACVELVTINGRPFSLMDDSGFKKIITPCRSI